MASSLLFSPAPYHIISYGTLLGASAWHSFVGGPVMFKNSERPSFSATQSALFPIYFSIQTAIPAILALTFPASPLLGVPGGLSGLLNESSWFDSLLPIATAFIGGAVNLTFLMPVTMQIMKERRGQVKRDGKEWYDEGPHSEEMQALNKRFGRLHGLSMLVNLVTLVSTVAYGFTLGHRLQSVIDRAA